MKNNLRKIREAKGISQSDLAKKIGTYPQQIYRLENKEDSLELKWLSLIAKALDVNVLELIFDEEDWRNMDLTNAYINNSVISQGNSNINTGALGDMEKEILDIFGKLSIKDKARAVISLYEMLDKIDEL